MFQKTISLIFSISLISNICYADDITYIEKDKPAPYEGYIFTIDKTKDTRIKLLERDTFQGLNVSLTTTNTFLQQNSDFKDKQIKLVQDRNDQLSQALKDSQSSSNLEKILWFSLGVVGTGLAVWGVKEITR